MDEINFMNESTCRICLQTEFVSIKSMFQSYSGDQQLSEIYNYCTGYTLSSIDSEITSICFDCELKLISCFQFKKQCDNSEERITAASMSEIIKREPVIQEMVYEEIFSESEGEPQESNEFIEFFDENEILEKIKVELKEQSINSEQEPDTFEDFNDLYVPVDGKFVCPHCNKAYRKDFLLKSHIERQHQSSSKATEKCHKNKSITINRKLEGKLTEKDIIAKHEAEMVLKKRKLTPEEKLIPRTRKVNHIEELCVHCGLVLSRAHCLLHERRMREARGEGTNGPDTSVSCDVCGKVLKHKHYLKRHLALHSDFKRYKCEYCGESFAQWIGWKTHITIKHTRIKSYLCKLCGESFVYSNQLTDHRRQHTGELPFECNWPGCEMKFIHKSKLDYHNLSHTKERNSVCSECNASFKTEHSLKRHMTIHTGIKNYECPVCSKKFIQPHMVKNHMKSHPGANVEIKLLKERQRKNPESQGKFYEFSHYETESII